jgi:hypothetical protein
VGAARLDVVARVAQALHGALVAGLQDRDVARLRLGVRRRDEVQLAPVALEPHRATLQ